MNEIYWSEVVIYEDMKVDEKWVFHYRKQRRFSLIITVTYACISIHSLIRYFFNAIRNLSGLNKSDNIFCLTLNWKIFVLMSINFLRKNQHLKSIFSSKLNSKNRLISSIHLNTFPVVSVLMRKYYYRGSHDYWILF